MITASTSTSLRAYARLKPLLVPISDGLRRYHGFQTNGEMLQIPNERNREGALVASRVWRRSDTLGLWIRTLTKTANVLMATDWSLTRTQYAQTETQKLIDETGRANTHVVEVPGVTTGIDSVPLQEMFGGKETEAETMDEMIMRTAIGGDSSNE